MPLKQHGLEREIESLDILFGRTMSNSRVLSARKIGLEVAIL